MLTIGCSSCGKNYNETPFASLHSRVCIVCERKSMRKCRCCGIDKPLTDYALCHTMQSGRENRCKSCKCKKIRTLKYCYTCGISIAGATNTKYCDECRKEPRAEKTNSEMGDKKTSMQILMLHRILSSKTYTAI